LLLLFIYNFRLMIKKGVTVGDHYLNICMNDNYVPYVAKLAKYSKWTALGSYVFFFIGVFLVCIYK